MLDTTLTKSRPYTPERDLQTVCELLNLCSNLDDLNDTYTLESLRLEFDHPQMDKELDLRVWEGSDERLLGFGQCWILEAEHNTLDTFLYFRVHPDARNSELPHEIVEWGTQRAQTEAAKRGMSLQLASNAREHEKFSQEVLEQHDFKVVRYYFHMARDLNEPIPEPQFPAGFVLRHTEGEAEAEQWVEVFNQSFIDHWNHHPAKVEDHKHWLKDPEYRAEDDLVAIAPDGTWAGFCFCRVEFEKNQLEGKSEGWIETLGTRRGFRKIGLGRALLVAGLRRLKANGLDTALLGVDAENPSGALKLYEDTGFVKRYASIRFHKQF